MGAKELDSMLKDFNIKERWSSFGKDVAIKAVSKMSSIVREEAAGCTVICFFTFNFQGAGRSLFDSFWHINYWKALPKEIWHHKMILVLSFLGTFQWVIEPFIKLLNSFLPSNTPGSGVIKKILRYYDKGGVPTELIPSKKPPQG